jgi:succinate dehydrogenase / fumarate reductase cytochrome b subunit
MNRISSLYSSSIGKKFIAAVTGLLLLGFLVGHVAGNLKVFTGSSADGVPHIDQYGQFLKELGEPVLPYMAGLWMARVGLLVCLVLHVVVVIQLALQSSSARPAKYVRSQKVAASLPARWMMYSGLLILAFVVFHILHFTTGTIRLGEFEHGTIYRNLSSSFALWPVAVSYIFVMLVLGLHLFHGVWSLFQTLGFDNPDRNRFLRALAMVLTIGIVVGFILVPLSFVIGVMPDPVEYVPDLLTKG